MSQTTGFKRARSPLAKRQRERDILEAASALALARSVRDVTLTDIANAVGLHKSAMLRYFETREQIFLSLTAEQYQDWFGSTRTSLGEIREGSPSQVAGLLARSLVSRPLFCDLLAQAPLNLERNVSHAAVKEFKLVAIASTFGIAAELERLFSLEQSDAVAAVAVATSMAGALWQMAAPNSGLADFYLSEPELAHAVIAVEPRLAAILTAVIRGFAPARPAARRP